MSSILTRVAEGDQEAVAQCISEYGGLVWSLARRMSPTASDAEDAVQEIFLDLWKNSARYEPGKSSEATFVAMIARRRLIDRYRRIGARVDTVSDEGVEVDDEREENAPENSYDVLKAGEVIASLRDAERQVLELGLLLGYSHQEIANQTGMALGTVKTHTRRGLARVRNALRLSDD